MVRFIGRRRGGRHGRLLGVLEILLPKLVPHVDQAEHREQLRKRVPRAITLQGIAQSREKRTACTLWRHAVLLYTAERIGVRPSDYIAIHRVACSSYVD